MNRNKMRWIIGGVVLFVVLLIGCVCRPLSMNDLIDKPNFIGTVIEVQDNSLLVLVDENEDEFKSSDKIMVSLNTQIKDDITQFKVGDRIKIIYDGRLAESYPAQINTVYTLLLLSE